MSSATVLVVDDDESIRLLVSRLLERTGHLPVQASDGQAAIKAFFDRRPDLVVLDVDMPGLNGWQVLERIRELSDVPVLMLTAAAEELDKVRGLKGGADDFVTKPFGLQELLARVEALLRRARGSAGTAQIDAYSDGLLEVDHQQRLARVAGRELRLTPLEFRLLAAFVRHPGQVLSADQLLELVWGDPYVSTEQVKLLVGRLRRKLDEQVADSPIETIRGFGYRYLPPTG